MGSLTVGVLKEQHPHERRVALIPAEVKRLVKAGAAVKIAGGAGSGAFIPDAEYEAAGGQVVPDNAAVASGADIVVGIHPLSSEALAALREGAVVFHLWRSETDLRQEEYLAALRERKATFFALDLIPRTTRAQFLDVLSSQATVAGYKAMLLAAHHSPQLFPMLTTAAGTLRPARALVIGAGVAGLQAIATARRLGAQVFAYDVRQAAAAEAESVGARFLASPVIAEGKGGYARALSEEEQQTVHDFLKKHVATMDVVVTTAQVPGRSAPRIITEDMVAAMKPGSVIVDMAATSGGNCALSRPGEVVTHGGVKIVGPVNLPAEAPIAASHLFSKNIYNFLDLLGVGKEQPVSPQDDEILAATCVLYQGRPLTAEKAYAHA